MKIKKQSMSKKILDIYSDYLICQNKYATATGLSDLLSGDISHDKITKYLNSEDLGSKELWLYIKPEIRKHELNKGGVLILDDSIEEKPYTDENEIVAWHHSYAKGMHVKGINILSCLVSYGDVVLPFGYALIRKDVSFSDIETGKVQRKSSMSKNQHFRNLIKQSTENKVLFEHILSDNWFGSKENMEFIESLGKKFIIGINSNRIIALSCKDKKLGKFQQISSLDMQDGESKKVWLKCVSFKVLLIKKVFINEDGSTGILYLASNDTEHDAAYLYKIYQKRWRIEEYHKSIKGSCIQYVDCCVYYRFLKSSYIATVEVKCRFCNQPEDVKKHGKCNMHQRYRFQQCRKTFQFDYLYRACNPGIKEQIVNLAMNNAGIRDTARALGVSINAVVRVLKNSRHAL